MPSIYAAFLRGEQKKSTSELKFQFTLFFISSHFLFLIINTIVENKEDTQTQSLTMLTMEPNKMVRKALSYELSGAFESNNKQKRETKIMLGSTFGM